MNPPADDIPVSPETLCPSDGELLALMSGFDETSSPATAHLEVCERCRGRLETLSGADETAGLLNDFASWQRRNREIATLLTPVRDSGPPDPAAPVSFHELDDLMTPSPPGRDLLGQLGHLEVREVIGEGGMGIVLSAQDPYLDREVAVKLLKPSLARYPELAAQFLEEAKAVAAISHENVVPIHQVAAIRGVPYLVMPLARGDTLSDRLLRDGRPDFGTALGLCIRVTRGLAAAHAAGVLHRDVKPDNVLTQSREGNPHASVWLADFGLARRGTIEPPATGAVDTAGTPGYLAPEVAAGGQGDARSDLYALGALFEALVEVPRAPTWFRGLVRSLGQEDPARRPASADAVLATLLQHESDLVISGWWRRFAARVGRLAARASLIVLPLGMIGSGIDIASGSRFTNAALSFVGFGGMEVVGKFGVHHDLAKAVAKAQSGDTILVRGPGAYLSDTCEISGKTLAIMGSSTDAPPEIHLSPEATRQDPLLRCRDGASLTLQGVSLVHWPSDAASVSPLPPLIHQLGGTLTIENCELRRVKVGDNLRPVGILADEVGKISLTNTRLHLNRSILVSWQWRENRPPPRERPVVSFIDCLVSADRTLLVTPESASAITLEMGSVKANLNSLVSFRRAPKSLDFRVVIRDSAVQTRVAFFTDFDSGNRAGVPGQMDISVENSRFSHLGAPDGMPAGLNWRNTPLFIEHTWMLIE